MSSQFSYRARHPLVCFHNHVGVLHSREITCWSKCRSKQLDARLRTKMGRPTSMQHTLTDVSIPLTARSAKCGWPSMTFTTALSPSYMPWRAPVALSQMKKLPSSDPETTHSSNGPRKLTEDKLKMHEIWLKFATDHL